MTPADQRVMELVDKWLKSLELHIAYTNLTDEAYWQVQPWVRHQRPARWILDLAHTRATEVKRQLELRIGNGDSSFSETLELMSFLANLVGVQSIERFIPLAEPERENREALAGTLSTLKPLNSTSTQTRALVEPTREMRMPPKDPSPTVTATVAGPALRVEPPAVPTLTVPVVVAPPAAAPAPPRAPPAAPEPPRRTAPAARQPDKPRPAEPAPRAARSEPLDLESLMPRVAAPAAPAASTRAAPPPSPPSPPPAPAPRATARREARGAGKAPRPPAPGSIDAQVVADAVRLVKWGRAWHELAEAIARIADRPGVVEVRKILRTHKTEIERQSAE